LRLQVDASGALRVLTYLIMQMRTFTPRGPLCPGLAVRLPAIRHGLKKIQYRPGLIEGCLAGTGLTMEPDRTRWTS
jgi:hypothetical protein